MIFILRFEMYDNKCKLKTFSKIYKCLDIKHNNILLKTKPF